MFARHCWQLGRCGCVIAEKFRRPSVRSYQSPWGEITNETKAERGGRAGGFGSSIPSFARSAYGC